jgi:hypothetical protein
MCSKYLWPARPVKRASVGTATHVNRAVTRSAVGGRPGSIVVSGLPASEPPIGNGDHLIVSAPGTIGDICPIG